MIKIYTDGACSGNPGPGGFAAIILVDKKLIIEKKFLKYSVSLNQIDSKINFLKVSPKKYTLSGASKLTTNNKMELFAVLISLYILQSNNLNKEKVLFYIDSQYVVNGINSWMYGWAKKGWKTQTGKVKNLEIWMEIYDLRKQFTNAEFSWVRGHDGDILNEECDKLARDSMETFKI